jgi:hypothetical protein
LTFPSQLDAASQSVAGENDMQETPSSGGGETYIGRNDKKGWKHKRIYLEIFRLIINCAGKH